MTIFPVKKEIEKLSNKELLAELKQPKKFKKVELYPVLAKRSDDDDQIRNLMYKEIISVDNQKNKVFNFIKMSWIPALCILENSNENIKKKLPECLEYWGERDKENFLNYIKKEANFIKYFNRKSTNDSMKLEKKIPLQKLGLNARMIYSGQENEQATLTIQLDKINDDLKPVSFPIRSFRKNKFDQLSKILSEADFATLIKTANLSADQLGEKIYYDTQSRLSAYYHLINKENSNERFLLCLGYGEFQPMRYVVTLECIYKLV